MFRAENLHVLIAVKARDCCFKVLNLGLGVLGFRVLEHRTQNLF